MYASPWIADTYVLIDDDRILDAILGCVPIVLEVPSAFQRAMPSFFFVPFQLHVLPGFPETKHCIVGHCVC